MAEAIPAKPPRTSIGSIRLAIGLAQGVGLYWLYRAVPSHSFPADSGLVFAPILMVTLYIPLMALVAIGTMRLRAFIPMLLLSGAALASFAWYDIWRVEGSDSPGFFSSGSSILPSVRLMFLSGAGLFAVQALVTGADQDRAWIARYTTHFDVAWKLALQLQLTMSFVALFWMLLALGAQLFLLIGMPFFSMLIIETWFSIPVTALAAAGAIHLTDVRVVLVRGMRTLVLAMNSWLLPVLTALAAAFLFSLFVAGIEPLWSTRRATVILLSAAALLIVLINTAYQDGSPERRPPALLRLAGLVAAFLLVPLIALAGQALLLRVTQYGWTSDRIMTAAAGIVGTVYALGYAIAALLTVLGKDRWLKRLEASNIAAAYVAIAVIAAVLSPIADPSRLSVRSQLARLESGAVTADRFDYAYLRREGGRYGKEALDQLVAQGQNVPPANTTGGTRRANLTPERIAESYTVHGGNGMLPASFLQQDWSAQPYLINNCVRDQRSTKCDAFIADLNGDQADDIFLYDDNNLLALSQDPMGKWVRIGQWRLPFRCAALIDPLKAENYELAPTEPSPYRDLLIGGVRLPFNPDNPPVVQCPK